MLVEMKGNRRKRLRTRIWWFLALATVGTAWFAVANMSTINRFPRSPWARFEHMRNRPLGSPEVEDLVKLLESRNELYSFGFDRYMMPHLSEPLVLQSLRELADGCDTEGGVRASILLLKANDEPDRRLACLLAGGEAPNPNPWTLAMLRQFLSTDDQVDALQLIDRAMSAPNSEYEDSLIVLTGRFANQPPVIPFLVGKLSSTYSHERRSASDALGEAAAVPLSLQQIVQVTDALDALGNRDAVAALGAYISNDHASSILHRVFSESQNPQRNAAGYYIVRGRPWKEAWPTFLAALRSDDKDIEWVAIRGLIDRFPPLVAFLSWLNNDPAFVILWVELLAIVLFAIYEIVDRRRQSKLAHIARFRALTE